jgi:RNA polymerase sigma-70 factor (ECF subfamily)
MLDGLRAGDLDATNQLIALVTRCLANRGAFEIRDSWDDLVQEVLISLIQKPPRSREPGAIVRHIQTTCYRLYVDEIRRARGRKRRKVGEAEDSGTGWRRNIPLEEAPEPVLTEPFWTRQMDLGVKNALEALEERQRRALEAVYLEGFTYAEAAVRLETPLGTLKDLLRGGLHELRRRIVGETESSPSDSPGCSVCSSEGLTRGARDGDGMGK